MPLNKRGRGGLRSALCGSVLCLAVLSVEGAERKNPRVLLIHSYHQGFEWTDSISQGVVDCFKDAHEPVRLSVEYMDSKLHEPSAITNHFHELCLLKYTDNPPDILICSDNNALAFLVEHRSNLFPQTPIVFCGINDYSAELLQGYTNITGIIEEPSYLETAQLARKIHPEARRIYAVACSAKTSTLHMGRFMQDAHKLGDDIEVIALYDLTMLEFADALAAVDKNDIVINMALHRTRDQKTLSIREGYMFIRSHTEAPVYNLWSAYLRDYSDYIAGGVMIDGEKQGHMAAGMAIQILNGVQVSQLPIVTDSPNIPILNYNELERLGLLHHPIPPGTTVINRPFSFYQTYRVLVWSVVIVIAGMAAQIIALRLSIRRRRRVEAELRHQGIALREREEKLRVTLDSINEAVIVTDVEGSILQLNPVAEELTGWSVADAVDRSIDEVLSIIDHTTRKPEGNPVLEVVEKGRLDIRTAHAVLVSRGETECRISGSGAPIRDVQGHIIGVVLAFRDMTDELLLQEKLQQGQKMDAIGQLAGGIAHDFNNMLGGIIASTEMAQIELGENKDPSDLLEMVLSAADRAASLTSKLLAFARRQPFASAPLEIYQPLQEALMLFSQTVDKRIQIHAGMPDEGLHVRGDFSLLQSVFLNLFINASHAMNEGGDLYISSRTVELDQNYCDMSAFSIQPGTFIEVGVRDTGEGIPEAALGRIFEPFFTTKEVGKGTGLGLAAVLGTIQQHGGAITVYSELDFGTNFHVLLPLTAQKPKESDEDSTELLCGTGTILVVDDEEIMRETCRAILEGFGYKVLVAADGVEGLETFKTEIARIDLIILDMVMPEMNGRDCFLAIREISKDVRIIISSGFSSVEELLDLEERGLTGVIRKPFRRMELGRMVLRAMQT